MPTQISYSRGAREVKVEEVILKLRSDLSQKSSNSLQISRPREINIQGGVLTVEDWQEKFRYVKSGYGHGHGENPTQQIDKDPDENPTPQINKDPEINIEAGGSGKSTDNPPARSWEDESYDDMLLHIYANTMQEYHLLMTSLTDLLQDVSFVVRPYLTMLQAAPTWFICHTT
ncbi:uncharacterized protein LOC112166780 isoform X2 [Rosa chinensis]|uniref:uncharacterized protein LOC112166780 isoform X2 n=1 Tax=Rosa chinensis TaxID=74649 RepID=UPI000D08C112|nr:uncharacterized protein LOC112166780 isoform X2 [Rosa chinensis]